MTRSLCLGLLLATVGCGKVTNSGNGNPPPVIESVSPARGGAPGGATITVTGSGFVANDAGDNFVAAGGLVASDVVAVDDSTLTFTLPPGTPEAVIDVIIFNENGVAQLPDAIQYNPFPRITAIDPTHVSDAGGDTVTIIGTGFSDLAAGDNTVTLGGVPVESVEVVSDGELTVVSAPRPDDVEAFTWQDVVVENANGAAALAEAVRYSKPGVLLTSRDFPSVISFLDLDTDPIRVVHLSTATNFIGGMALAPDGTLYGVTRCRDAAQSLVTVDPFTGVLEVVGPLVDAGGVRADITDIAFVDGELFGHAQGRSGPVRRLVHIDVTTGQYTPVGDSNDDTEANGRSVAITERDDSTVHLVTTTQRPLRVQSISDSALTDLIGLTGAAFDTRIKAVLKRGNRLIGVTEKHPVTGANSPTIIEIDPSTGQITPLGMAELDGSALSLTPPGF